MNNNSDIFKKKKVETQIDNEKRKRKKGIRNNERVREIDRDGEIERDKYNQSKCERRIEREKEKEIEKERDKQSLRYRDTMIERRRRYIDRQVDKEIEKERKRQKEDIQRDRKIIQRKTSKL